MDIVFATHPSLALLIVRVVLGVVFFAHGEQKVSAGMAVTDSKVRLANSPPWGCRCPLRTLCAFWNC
jgi:uncharacterized membrane protein YphA (DoxX/SURF4 family)